MSNLFVCNVYETDYDKERKDGKAEVRVMNAHHAPMLAMILTMNITSWSFDGDGDWTFTVDRDILTTVTDYLDAIGVLFPVPASAELEHPFNRDKNK